MLDKNLLLRDGSTDLTASANGSGVDFGAADGQPVTYVVRVPQAGGTTPTLDIKIQESDDNSTWRDFLALPQITAKGEYMVTGLSDARYRRATWTVGGTSPDFGKVVIGPDVAGRYTKR